MSCSTPDERAHIAGGAYWAMVRRVIVIAGGVHAAWIALYAMLGAQALAALNVLSVAMYVAAWGLIGRRRNALALRLILAEVLGHSIVATLLMGWYSGFHYFLLLFIPVIVVGAPRRTEMPTFAALLAVYLGLDVLSARLGPLSPLPALAMQIAHWLNIALVFATTFAVMDYYRATVVAAERRLRQMATTDPLTGLANRHAFHERALTEIARCRRRGEPVSLMLADVDFFKRINDEYGHEAGDAVLVRLAELIRNALRETDVIARWGGEEFIALLPASDETAAIGLAERVRHAAATARIDIGGHTVSATLSFGIATCTGADDLKHATARADLALYASKRSGRNCVSAASAAAPPEVEPEPEPSCV